VPVVVGGRPAEVTATPGATCASPNEFIKEVAEDNGSPFPWVYGMEGEFVTTLPTPSRGSVSSELLGCISMPVSDAEEVDETSFGEISGLAELCVSLEFNLE